MGQTTMQSWAMVMILGAIAGLAQGGQPGQRTSIQPKAPAADAGARVASASRGTEATTQAFTALESFPITCAVSIRDQSDPPSCIKASSVATAGFIFPYPGQNNVLSGTYAFVGGGSDNQATGGTYGLGHTTVGGGQYNTASGDMSTIGGGSTNYAIGNYATIGGGSHNAARNGAGSGHTTVSGGEDNNADGNWATIGGGDGNEALRGGSTIGGGLSNLAFQDGSTVAGGDDNNALGIRSFVGGGTVNTASGYGATVCGGGANFAVGRYSTVAGGKDNVANFDAPSSLRSHAAIGGGRGNSAAGSYATVGGGGGYFLGNSAAGLASTVPGGRLNSAAGDFSFAAGRRAKANHAGSFVWGDSQDADKTSSSTDEFNVYASGGARIFSDAGATTGVVLAPGAGSWSSVSDRAAKENLLPVDPREVLARVLSLPISTWNYVTQDDSIRHIGPMAQDFHAAFGVGTSDRTIDTIDPDGVALAAIQGLHRALEENEAQIAELRKANAMLEARLARLERQEEDKTGCEQARR